MVKLLFYLKVGQISFSLLTLTVQFLQVLFGKALFCFHPRTFVEYCVRAGLCKGKYSTFVVIFDKASLIY
jgi:hypothetical protein